ncbi:E3 ubiquitin-protein ligase Mdm2-like isoform X2 [Leguminivora glycinivorella]|uniref:E3 ubiquitin-protein ligase Mdm2-like isoform X2 n=1 Tax=Leguminivora glycinivorella TaxID=1035111 RepID=UPI00200E7639|nr:E3 ubiquitin-protein ligase Mdm2-like isoform X2 [Leguminivora glycinivorella]
MIGFSWTESWRGSKESISSLQDKETDYVRDTSDTDCSSDKAEYEPVTEPEDDGPLDWDSSGQSDNEIIATKVIEVSVGDDGDLEFADSEQDESEGSDSEMDLHDFWECAQCRAENNNPLYRYCEKCFKVRKNFFPPRPRKNKRKRVSEVPRTSSVDSGVESAFNSQETLSQVTDSQGTETQVTDSQRTEILVTDSQGTETQVTDSQGTDLSQPGYSLTQLSQDSQGTSSTSILSRPLKRRAESADRNNKRMRIDYSDSDTDSDDDEPRRRKAKSADPEVAPLVKTTSDPSLTIDDSDKLTKKAIFNSIKDKFDNENLCIICYAEPKSAVFVHGRIAHICCCYECANKVWRKAKRCPQCNCKVSNVLRVL